MVKLPLQSPFETSFARESEKEALLVRMGAEGAEGWGECITSPSPFYSYETNWTARHIIKDFLLPLLKVCQPFDLDGALASFQRVRGHPMAKAALENALLDLFARIEGVPLYSYLGGKKRRIHSGISLGIREDIDLLLEEIGAAVKRGYQRIKVKIKRGKDVSVLREIRKTYPEIPLTVDANADYTLADAGTLKQLDEFKLLMIEQPLGYDDLFEHARLQQQIETPICLDESIKNLGAAALALQLNSCRIVNIKQGRVGGMLAARTIQALCLEKGIDVWSGGMLETGIGRAFNIHLQSLPGFSMPGDTSETARYFAADIVEPAVRLDGEGYIAIPPGDGIGVRVIPERLADFQVLYERWL